MATTLPAPTVTLAGIPSAGAVAGLALPATEATSLSAAQFNFVNNGAMFLRVVATSITGASIEILVQKTTLGYQPPVTAFAQTLTTATSYIFGPFSPSTFNDANSLCWFTMTATVTTASAGLYFVPGAQT